MLHVTSFALHESRSRGKISRRTHLAAATPSRGKITLSPPKRARQQHSVHRRQGHEKAHPRNPCTQGNAQKHSRGKGERTYSSNCAHSCTIMHSRCALNAAARCSSKGHTVIKVLLQAFQRTPAIRKQSGDSPKAGAEA